MRRVLRLTVGVFVALHLPSLCRLIEAVVAIRASSSFSGAEAARVIEGVIQDEQTGLA